MTPLKVSGTLRLIVILSVALLTLGCVLLMRLSASDLVIAELPPLATKPPTEKRTSLAISPEQEFAHASVASLTDSEIAVLLSESGIGILEPKSLRMLGSAMIPRALREDRMPEEYVASILPTTSKILAMLARDRDVDDYLENAAEKGPAGAYYQSVADLVPSMKPLRENYESFFEGVSSALDEMGRTKVAAQAYAASKLYRSGVTLPRFSSKPRERDYDYSHTFALDIFLKDVETLPFSTLEKGPVLFSLTDSIVIATDSSWRGGEELQNYHSGGITPKAGNGAILYSPDERKYYLYFHLYDVLVTPGERIPAGYPLGHGGNTGTNARKPGHGEHLHLEIYDSSNSRFLRNYEIADIVF
jgi:hypothetical protein